MTDGAQDSDQPPRSNAVLPFRAPNRIEGPGSQERLKALQKKFHRTRVDRRGATARWFRWRRLKYFLIAALVIAAVAVAYLPDFGRNAKKFGSQDLAWRHALASPDCDAARSVGLANARVGQPGYYPQHDADNDGIACEPYPR
jgi:Excalibur calcium-binding domain